MGHSGASAWCRNAHPVLGRKSMSDLRDHTHSSQASTAVERLLDKARQGDRLALEQLVELFREYLLLIANSELTAELRAKVGASDLVQETIVQAHQHFHEFAGGAATEFRGWIRAILLNRIFAVRRHYCGTQQRDLSREVSWDEQQGAAALLHAADDTPSKYAALREQRLAINEAMQSLPPEYRQVLWLRYWERLTFVEIGDCMGRSPDAARKLWLRAIDRLQGDGGLNLGVP